MKVVVKYGGASLANGRRVERAAHAIKEVIETGHEAVVVASAMGDTTDKLLDDLCPDASENDRAEVVSMGERTSARMLKSYLSAMGVDATVVEPGLDEWPIFVRPEGENAVAVEETRRGVERFVEQTASAVPVVTGFLAEDQAGNVRTLGRGGSDTTAMILANFMDADRVVLVTDVRGILTGDPDTITGATQLDGISVEEVRELVVRGSGIVAPTALKYKRDAIELNVVHYEQDDLLRDGTDVYGEFETIFSFRDVPFAGITVAGTVSDLSMSADIVEALSTAEVAVENLFVNVSSITCYVRRDALDDARDVLHDLVKSRECLSSLSTIENVAIAHVNAIEREAEPDGIRQVALLPFNSELEIFDMEVTSDSVTVYLPWDDRDYARDLLQSATS